jgi:hypothetical protein
MDLSLHYWKFSIPANPQRIAGTLAAAALIADQAGFRRIHRDGSLLSDGAAGERR